MQGESRRERRELCCNREIGALGSWWVRDAMFDRRVQILKNCESIRVFLAEGHCRSLESSRRELGGIGHLDSGRTLRMVGEVV